MIKKSHFIIVVSIFLLTINLNTYGQENVNNSLTFIQGDSSFKIIRTTDSIRLDRKPFALRYFGKRYDDKNEIFYSAQIAVLDNPNDTLILKIGQSTKDISYFEPETRE